MTDRTGNYSISYAFTGRLKIDPRPITVKGGSAEKIYDGTSLASDGYEIVSALELADGHIGVAQCDGTITDFGTADNIINSFTVYNGTASPENDMSRNYSVTLSSEPGTLMVTQRPITVTTKGKSWIYDAEQHYYIEYDIAPAAPLTASDAAIVGTQKDVVVDHTTVRDVMIKDGKVTDTPNEIHIKITESDGVTDRTGNYKITYEFTGRLKIEPRPITVTTESKEWTYADTDYDWQRYDIKPRSPLTASDEALVDSQKASVAKYTTVHNVMRKDGKVIGTPNKLEIEITDGSGADDMTDNYDIAYVYGTLTVKPIEIKYISGSAEKYFDGEPLMGSSAHIDGYAETGAVIVDPSAVLAHHTAAIKAVSKRVYPGAVANAVALEVKSGADDVTENYEPVAEKIGTLTVKKVKITVVTSSDKKIYDDTPLTNGGYAVNFTAGKYSSTSDLPSWFKSAVTVIGTITDFGDADNTAEIKIIYNKSSASAAVELSEADGADMTGYYDITYDFGTLTVTQRYITVQTGHTELIDGVNRWDYDGNPHSDPYFAAIVGDYSSLPPEAVAQTGLVAGHSLAALTELSVTHAGVYDNKFKLKIENADGEVKTSNYYLVYVRGKLEIKARKITVATATKTWKYDGNPHSDYTLKVESEQGLLDGHSIAADSECTITDVGTKINEFLVAITDVNGNVVTEDYEITWDLGTLTVEKNDEGEGGGEGGGEGDGNGDFDIAYGKSDPVLVLTYETNYKGIIYLRESSGGRYVGRGFKQAPVYPETIEENGISFGMNYLPSTILRDVGANEYYLNVKYEPDMIGHFALPYFTALHDDGQNQVSDTVNTPRLDGSGNPMTEYSVDFYPYMYTSDSGATVAGGVGAKYSAAEEAYATFVYNNYLQIPTSTLSYMLGVAEDNGLVASDPDIIKKVARFIQNAAEYKKEYDHALDTESDKATAFLDKYKKGICQHYATSATMLFRALGIPARYTVGIVAYSDGSGNPTELMSDNLHAWTEVYIKGVGWVAVEVTGGSSDGGDLSDGEGEVGGEYEPEIVRLKPVDVYVESGDAMPINAVVEVGGGDWLYGKLNSGYSYDVTVERVGEESAITSFKLYDIRGYDVTPMYAERLDTSTRGKLVTTGRTQVYVEIYSLQKEYDGTPLSFNNDDFYVISDGYTVTIDMAGIGITDAGVMNTEDLRAALDDKCGERGWYTVRDAANVDVTDTCFVILSPEFTEEYVTGLRTGKESLVVQEITRRNILLKSGTATKVYDGQPLTFNDVKIMEGSLIDGHELKYKCSASITDIGRIENKFVLQISDAGGQKVSQNYWVRVIYGTLTVEDSN